MAISGEGANADPEVSSQKFYRYVVIVPKPFNADETCSFFNALSEKAVALKGHPYQNYDFLS